MSKSEGIQDTTEDCRHVYLIKILIKHHFERLGYPKHSDLHAFFLLIID